MTMKKDVTLGNLISIAVTLFVLVLGWGISMTSRMDVSDNKIENNRENIINIQDKLDRILYRSLKD